MNKIAFSSISAVTLAVERMAVSIEFYEKLGMSITYGGANSSFTTLRSGNVVLNLISNSGESFIWWGRVIIRVVNVDEIYSYFIKVGLNPDAPQNADWGERFFHIWDPDGHELSFAELLTDSSY